PRAVLLDEAVVGGPAAEATVAPRRDRADPASPAHLPVDLAREDRVALVALQLVGVLRRERPDLPGRAARAEGAGLGPGGRPDARHGGRPDVRVPMSA